MNGTRAINSDNVKQAINIVKTCKPHRSAWDRGVNAYAIELLESLAEDIEWNGGTIEVVHRAEINERMRNGAITWTAYSYGGSALVYDYDIAERLCAPWELRRTRNGERNPNSRETWLDVQARALYQAAGRAADAVWQTC